VQVGNSNAGRYATPAQVGNYNAGWYVTPVRKAGESAELLMIYRSVIGNKKMTKYAEAVMMTVTRRIPSLLRGSVED
jgi:hypothetical protein